MNVTIDINCAKLLYKKNKNIYTTISVVFQYEKGFHRGSTIFQNSVGPRHQSDSRWFLSEPSP